MKKVIIIAFVMLIGSSNQIFAQKKEKKHKAKTEHKDKDGIDGRMKGPNGEAVLIGEKGGRYYLNAEGTKVYVERNKKDKKDKKGKKKGKKKNKKNKKEDAVAQ